jgi:hypothetical protein
MLPPVFATQTVVATRDSSAIVVGLLVVARCGTISMMEGPAMPNANRLGRPALMEIFPHQMAKCKISGTRLLLIIAIILHVPHSLTLGGITHLLTGTGTAHIQVLPRVAAVSTAAATQDSIAHAPDKLHAP